MKIVLVGYMASGKSTVGRLLARQLGVEFIDLDDYIEQHQKNPLKPYFLKKGKYFSGSWSIRCWPRFWKKRNPLSYLREGEPHATEPIW